MLLPFFQFYVFSWNLDIGFKFFREEIVSLKSIFRYNFYAYVKQFDLCKEKSIIDSNTW